MKQLIYTLAVLLLVAVPAVAQTESDTAAEVRPNLRMIARSYGDSVVLRWGTTSHTSWKVAGKAGYIIERYEYNPQGKLIKTVLTPQPLKPLTIDEWKARYRPEDTLAGAAVQALYGKAIPTSEDPFGSIYEIYLQQRSMHGIALLLADIAPRLADGLGLRFVDRTVDPNKTYRYRIYSLANDPNQPVDTADVALSISQRDQPKNVATLTAEEGEQLVVLKWNRLEHLEPFSGYFIERSNDGGRSFSRLNRMPFTPLQKDDSSRESDRPNVDMAEYKVRLETNYQPAQYRVVGIDPFGEVSPNSNVITAMGRDRTPPSAPQILPIAIVDGRSIKVTWRMDTLEGDLKGFMVGKSEGPDGEFEQIGEMLGRDAREFTDPDVRDLPQHYYAVVAVDTAGNRVSSVPLLGIFPDSIPPATPRGLAGTVDSNGVVRLRWDANPESDLKGYRVFYANQDDHEYQQLTGDLSQDTTFTDTLTLQTLSEEIYYKITALDQNYNHSEFTTTLVLKKPDIVAPFPPFVSNITPGEKSIIIEWAASMTGDVVEHALYRRADGETDWKAIANIKDRSVNSFTDSTAVGGTLYQYSLDAADDAGLRSERSNIVDAQLVAATERSGVQGLVGQFDQASKHVVVRWNATDGAAEYYLYKAIGDAEPTLYRSVANTKEFVDTEVFPGNTYRYAVKVVGSDGRESGLASTGKIVVGK